MINPLINRRQALVGIAGIAVAAPVLARPAFSNEDLQVLALLVDIVIPRTETPGASDVGVHLYIDHIAAVDSGLKWTLQQGISALRKQDFLDLSPGWQTDVFVDSPLFQLVKELTIDGYYGTQEGLAGELGYHGATFVAEFQGCTHPEHQHADS
jgi:hypothetical protein